MRRAWAEAAIASRWPTLHLLVADEATAERAEAVLERALGALPHGEILEPGDDGPWELRVDLPDLSLDALDAIEAALDAAGLPAPLIVPGEPPARRAALDTGALFADTVVVDGVEWRQWLLADGTPAPLDVVRRSGVDAEVVALERELAEAIRTVDPRLVFETDRGPDTVDPIVHRPSGRFGVLATLGRDTLEPFDDLDALRQGLCAALAGVIRARVDHPRLRLAPDPFRDERWGWGFGLWISAWSVAPSPGDAPIGPGRWPRGEIVDPAFAGLFDAIELQAVPATADDHLAVALSGADAAADTGATPASPRWVRAPGWVFAPTWRCPPERIGEVLPRFAAVDAYAVRAVPADPIGLEDLGDLVDSAWHVGELRWIGRLRDGRTDRDLAPRWHGRTATDRDLRLIDELRRLAAVFPGAAEGIAGTRPVGDDAGRRAVEVNLTPATAAEPVWRAVLDVIGLCETPGLADVALVAQLVDGPRAWVLWDEPVTGPPVWRGIEAAP